VKGIVQNQIKENIPNAAILDKVPPQHTIKCSPHPHGKQTSQFLEGFIREKVQFAFFVYMEAQVPVMAHRQFVCFA
jgi:hypothetical protein